MLGDVNKLFVFKSLSTMSSNVLSLHLRQIFPLIIGIFYEGEGDGIKSRLPFKNQGAYWKQFKLSWPLIKVDALLKMFLLNIWFLLGWSEQKLSGLCVLLWPINHFNALQQNRQQVWRAYCPNIRTVIFYIRLESFSANDRLVEKET